MNLMTWMTCEVSAHYHNQRLVEWEPFIEPWTFGFRVGVDLMAPVPIECDTPRDDTAGVVQSEVSSSTVARLAHLSRLFRSQFGTGEEDSGLMV